MSHNTSRMKINGEDVDIDIGIIPTVQWLNSIPRVITISACQGEDNINRPYVLFKVDDKNSLDFISKIAFISPGCPEIILFGSPVFHIYKIRWENVMCLNVFQKELSNSIERAKNKDDDVIRWYENMLIYL